MHNDFSDNDSSGNDFSDAVPSNDDQSVARKREARRIPVPRFRGGSAFFVVGYLGDGVYAVFATDAENRQFKLFEGSSIAEARDYLRTVQEPGDAIMMSDALRTLERLELPTAELRPSDGEPWQMSFLPTCELETVAGTRPVAGTAEASGPVESIPAAAPGEPARSAGHPIFVLSCRYQPTNRLSGITDLTIGAAPGFAAGQAGEPRGGDAGPPPENN